MELLDDIEPAKITEHVPFNDTAGDNAIAWIMLTLRPRHHAGLGSDDLPIDAL